MFKDKNKVIEKVKVHSRLVDIRIGRKYARGEDMNGNSYECFDKKAEEVYDSLIEFSDDLKDVNREYFKEGYDSQTKELLLVIKTSVKLK